MAGRGSHDSAIAGGVRPLEQVPEFVGGSTAGNEREQGGGGGPQQEHLEPSAAAPDSAGTNGAAKTAREGKHVQAAVAARVTDAPHGTNAQSTGHVTDATGHAARQPLHGGKARGKKCKARRERETNQWWIDNIRFINHWWYNQPQCQYCEQYGHNIHECELLANLIGNAVMNNPAKGWGKGKRKGGWKGKHFNPGKGHTPHSRASSGGSRSRSSRGRGSGAPSVPPNTPSVATLTGHGDFPPVQPLIHTTTLPDVIEPREHPAAPATAPAAARKHTLSQVAKGEVKLVGVVDYGYTYEEVLEFIRKQAPEKWRQRWRQATEQTGSKGNQSEERPVAATGTGGGESGGHMTIVGGK